MKAYVTFGFSHSHVVGSKILNRDCVCVFEADNYHDAKNRAFKMFGPKFCGLYFDDEWNEKHLEYYKNGYVVL